MGLFIRSTTLREVTGKPASFPGRVRNVLCQALENIEPGELTELLAKHEADQGNFDGTVEANLRQLDPALRITSNHRISDQMKFNNDLVIETDDSIVCLEIEKGITSRFEFDVLKMQAFSTSRKMGSREKSVFGAFVVPADNIVARHISGNARESSFRYLSRLCRLVCQIQPLHVEDILIIGYALAAQPEDKQQVEARVKGTPSSRTKATSNKLGQQKGLLPEEAIREALHAYPIDLVLDLRKRLAVARPALREKLNPKSRYLGYGLVGGSDDLYLYVQKKGLVIDIRLPADRTDELRRMGFKVRPRDNYQAKAGWLTGLYIPHDTDKRKELAALLLEALQGE